MAGGDVIAAVATAAGEGGIGVIRLSGAEALAVARRVWRGVVPEAGRFRHGYVVDPEDRSVIDEALLLVFRAPHSYTGEDVVELQCHGGSVALGRCLAAVLAAGARAARAGEFTERAFLNGRIDLSQAEAVIDVIRARTAAGLRQAVGQLSGRLAAAVGRLRHEAIGLLAAIEAAVDYPDEVDEPDRRGLAEQLLASATAAEALAGTYRRGHLVRDGLSVAIIGRPNVGKSSLLNALAGAERAIVTAVPGTTRDAVRDWVDIGGVPVELVDTAGLRAGGDEIERLGMERSRQWIERADVLMVVIDGHLPPVAEDEQVLTEVDCGRALLVLNKSDLGLSPAAVRFGRDFGAGLGVVEASAVTPGGCDLLVSRLGELARAGQPPEAGAVATRERHRRALADAAAALRDGAAAAQAGVPLDLLVIDLRRALQALGEITGETVSEDVIERIFADFCVGK
ncbi:MAG: tRNA uridine-5-carboxymethylaminomethyl(34) synthesis GTPase MnmE [Chloroflexota bacterium]